MTKCLLSCSLLRRSGPSGLGRYNAGSTELMVDLQVLSCSFEIVLSEYIWCFFVPLCVAGGTWQYLFLL